MKVQVIHGLGMDMRGIENIEIFGPMKLDEYNVRIREFADAVNIEVSIFHSNDQNEIINVLNQASELNYSGVLFNPAGFMQGFSEIGEAIKLIQIPVYELHSTNPVSRGRVSDLLKYCSGSITGFGVDGYRIGLSAIAHANKTQKP